MMQFPKNPSIYTQISTPVLNELRNKFNNYEQTPFTFVETSHRSKQYNKLNCETAQLIKNYFNAQSYICLLMPTGTAIPSFYFNLMKENTKVYSFANENSKDQFYEKMVKYNENINKISTFQQLKRIFDNQSSMQSTTIVHFSHICEGKITKLPQIQQQRTNLILIENLNYCFPWSKNKKITSDIAYFATQTGFSTPGYDVILIKQQLMKQLPNNQKCPDMFCFSLMHKQKSVVNTPFTLCTLVLNQNIRYAMQNSEKIKIKLMRNKKKFERKMCDIGAELSYPKFQAENMIVVNLATLDEYLKQEILEKNQGWKINNQNKFCFFIQLENSSLQKFLDTSQ